MMLTSLRVFFVWCLLSVFDIKEQINLTDFAIWKIYLFEILDFNKMRTSFTVRRRIVRIFSITRSKSSAFNTILFIKMLTETFDARYFYRMR